MSKPILCRVGFHKWKQIGEPRPLRTDKDFQQGFTGEWVAMGGCSECAILRLRNYQGTWGKELPITEKQYIEKYNEGELKWKCL